MKILQKERKGKRKGGGKGEWDGVKKRKEKRNMEERNPGNWRRPLQISQRWGNEFIIYKEL